MDGTQAAPAGPDPVSRPVASRDAVVDLGSNSVRLVVYEERGRNPVAIFNEKAVLGLGRGLDATGRLNEVAVERALTVMDRYHAVARAMGAAPLHVLATAAARDASNGPAFVEALRARLPGLTLRVLTGEEEATLSAEGVLLGVPGADGVLGDIGGGSLEVVELGGGAVRRAASLPLGTLRLSDRAGGDPVRAGRLAGADLATVPWLARGAGRDLYLVGGAWRALARVHMLQTGYPLSIVHHYALPAGAARALAGTVAAAPRRVLERMPGVSGKRTDDLPFAALVLRRLLRATGAGRVVFSANGLREGWYGRLLTAGVRAEDPLLAAGRDLARRFARDPDLPAALAAWTAPLFPGEAAPERALREAACLVSDIGSHDHPDYRAEQAFLRVLRQPGVGLDHQARAYLALAVALRYEAEPASPWLAPARALLDGAAMRRAEVLGAALRLAYMLCAGTPGLLAETALGRAGDGALRLALGGGGVFGGEGVRRRLEGLAALLGVAGTVEAA